MYCFCLCCWVILLVFFKAAAGYSTYLFDCQEVGVLGVLRGWPTCLIPYWLWHYFRFSTLSFFRRERIIFFFFFGNGATFMSELKPWIRDNASSQIESRWLEIKAFKVFSMGDIGRSVPIIISSSRINYQNWKHIFYETRKFLIRTVWWILLELYQHQVILVGIVRLKAVGW
jgi:hypothetical protein